jgi:uncharacterized protein
MASGLFALLDDVAVIAKLAAASLDDVAGAAGKAGTKAMGIVIDDTAVTPRYVVGFSPDRELPIIAKIARGSLFNKLALILPACLLLSSFAPWALTPLLMIGGAYLCFEAVEKLVELISGHSGAQVENAPQLADADHEKNMVAGAVRTDFILSAEIMVIALNEITHMDLWMRALILAAVGLVITVGVYGVVALIVKLDDMGVHLAKGRTAVARAVGRALVVGTPKLLAILSAVGTAAMLWVGGGIFVHGLEHFHITPLPAWLKVLETAAAAALPSIAGFSAWFAHALGAAIIGVVIGGIIVAAHHGCTKSAVRIRA